MILVTESCTPSMSCFVDGQTRSAKLLKKGTRLKKQLDMEQAVFPSFCKSNFHLVELPGFVDEISLTFNYSEYALIHQLT